MMKMGREKFEMRRESSAAGGRGSAFNQRGITLIGVLVALFVLVPGVVAVTQLIARTQHAVGVSRDKLVAAKLATEGLEIVRAQRDTNWLSEADWWTVGLCGSLGDQEDIQQLVVDVDAGGDPGWVIRELSGVSDDVLYEEASGLWSHVIGSEETNYRRVVTIDCKQQILPAGTLATDLPELIQVSSKVTWKVGGEDREVEVKENLYNWYREESVTAVVPIVLPGPATGFSMGGFEASIGGGSLVHNISAGTEGQVPVMPWIGINSFSFTFPPGTTVVEGDIELRGVNTPLYGISIFDYDSATDVATWTLPDDIINDRLALVWTADGSPYQLIARFDVLTGDASQNGSVDRDDLASLAAAAGSDDSLYDDFDQNGEVDLNDVAIMRGYYGDNLPEGEPNIE